MVTFKDMRPAESTAVDKDRTKGIEVDTWDNPGRLCPETKLTFKTNDFKVGIQKCQVLTFLK